MSGYEPYEHHFMNANDFHFYGVGIVIPFGLIGNLFSICIFLLSPILRRTTTGQYLVALAIADTTVLVGETLRWFTYRKQLGDYYLSASLGLNIYDTSIAACAITNFLRYGGSLWSVWLTIAIAVERLLAVALPLKISHISTLRRSRVVIFIITIISFSLALFSFWHFEIREKSMPQCKIMKERNDEYKTWTTVILKFGSLIIPGVMITVLTIIIIVLLYRARKKRMSQLAVIVRGPRKQWSDSGLSTETQLTIMLVAVCISTTALRTPYTVAYYFRSTLCWDQDCNALTNMQTYVAYRVTEVFNIINYAINFILYCLSGSLFREQIKKTFCRENKTGSNIDPQEISLETPLGSNNRLLKASPRASPSAQTNNL